MKCNSQSVKLRQKSKIPGELYFATVYFIVVFFSNKSELISEISYIKTICLLWQVLSTPLKCMSSDYIPYSQSIFQIFWKNPLSKSLSQVFVKYTEKNKQCFSALAILYQDFNWISQWTSYSIYLIGKNPSVVQQSWENWWKLYSPVCSTSQFKQRTNRIRNMCA